jgi:hypothetical protein
MGNTLLPLSQLVGERAAATNLWSLDGDDVDKRQVGCLALLRQLPGPNKLKENKIEP